MASEALIRELQGGFQRIQVACRVPGSNGEVQGPHDSTRLETRVHTVAPHPRRHYRASRSLQRLLGAAVGSSEHRCRRKSATFSVFFPLRSVVTVLSRGLLTTCTVASGPSPVICTVMSSPKLAQVTPVRPSNSPVIGS